MEFNSLNFAVFLTLVVVGYFLLPNMYRWQLLLGSSLLFSIFFGPVHIVILLTAAGLSYFWAIKIGQASEIRLKRFYLLTGISLNLLLLFLFKYKDFAMSGILGQPKLFEFNWVVPVGISFYTLQTVSYLVDVYKGKIHPERHFGYYTLYVSFFPTIMSGPIERAGNLLTQFRTNQEFSYDRVTYALGRIAWGLFKKVVVADRLMLYVNTVYDNATQYKGWPLIIATFFFSIQLYCDFSGYTDIAIGTANLFGYRLTENFSYPYFSTGIKEFWGRWHISLSTWLRDYVYFPLGGSRVSRVRSYLNVLTVFLISGFWHGPSLTFLTWGFIHGLYLIIEKSSQSGIDYIIGKLKIKKDGKGLNFFKIVVTFIAINFSWIFFRANSLSDAIYIINNLFINLTDFNKESITLNVAYFKIMVLSVIMFAVMELLCFNGLSWKKIMTKPIYIRWLAYYIAVMVILIFGVFQTNTFLYGKF